MNFRYKHKNTILKFFFLFFVAVRMFGQEGFGSGYQVSRLESLPQNEINAIFKDSKGFMWIGTLDGLIRFDGYSSKTYRIKQRQNSISSNMIIDIDEDSHGNIWIATFGKGLCKLDPVTESFTVYQQEGPEENRIISNDITCILVDGNIIWTGNWFGLSRIKLDESMSVIIDKELIHKRDLVSTNGGVEVKRIFKDNSGEIWLGLNSNLVRVINPYDPISSVELQKYPGHISSFCFSDSVLIAGGSNISRIEKTYTDSIELNLISHLSGHSAHCLEDIIWAGYRKGVYAFKLQEDKSWVAKKHFSTDSRINALSNNLITCIASDESKQIWVGTRGGGINIISPRRKHFSHFKNTDNPNSLSDNLMRSMFEDSKQNLWIGTEEGGLNYLEGNNRYNYTKGFKQYSIYNWPRENNRVYAIEEQLTPHSKKQERLMWLGTSFPTFLMALDPHTMESVQMPDYIRELGFVFTIEVQNDTTIWVGTYGSGLWKLITDYDGRIINRYHYTPGDSVPHPISSVIIRSLLFDKKGNLWIGTDKGLNRILAHNTNLSVPDFKVYRSGEAKGQLSYDYILQLFESSTGKIWMGSMGGGLIGIEEEHGVDSLVFSSLTTDDGLPNNSIKCILEDKNGNLWLSSNQGLTKYNPKNKDVVNYDVEDGLQDNEFAEIVGCSRKNGQLIFGGNNGINVFYPGQIAKDTLKPKLFFTDFYILNELVEPGIPYNGKVILEKSIEYTDLVKLKHNQNSFSIGFTGLQFNSAQKNNYKYILEGFDDKWFSATANYRIAKYTNVPPGEYTFKVLASNCDNVWVKHPITLNIKVKSHPLLSFWAYLCYSVLFAIVLFIIIRTALIIAKRKKEVLIAGIEKRNAEEVAQMKLRFFTNISHEFRTPLTLITIPLEKFINSGRKFTPDEMKNLNIIKQNTNMMLRLVSQILDFRKMEQSKMQLNLQQQDLVGFIKNIFESFVLLAEQKEIKFELITPGENLILSYDPVKIEKVVYNLISNALKFTPKQGEIKITIKDISEENQVHLVVSDTGIGIKESEQSRIFERYFQPQRKAKQDITGTGIGLALTKGLVELHNGEILLESEESVGSTFTVILPKTISDVNVIEDNNYSESILEGAISEETTLSNEDKADLLSFRTRKVDYKLLIVEDNAQLRETIADIFSEYFTVMQAEDGLIGYETCIKEDPHIVISDVMMPNMDGVELLSKIKNDENISHIPVILLTAKGSVEDKIDGLLSGADAYIAKPFEPDFLLANVISVLSNRERLRTTYQKEIEINPMVISNSPADARFMEKILALIEENLSEPDFNVDKLALAYGVSRIHLNRKIKALTGETPNQFLRNIRLKHAAELLKQNVLNVSEVTWKVGYNDLGTFRTRFKELFGVSPSDYAKKWQDNTSS